MRPDYNRTEAHNPNQNCVKILPHNFRSFHNEVQAETITDYVHGVVLQNLNVTGSVMALVKMQPRKFSKARTLFKQCRMVLA